MKEIMNEQTNKEVTANVENQATPQLTAELVVENAARDVDSTVTNSQVENVVLADNEKINNYRNEMRNGKSFTHAELKTAGFIFVYDMEHNRPVNGLHVKKLKASILKNGCLTSVRVLLGDEYLKFYPSRILKGKDGVAYRKDSPELSRCLPILDGQHRETSHEELLQEESDYTASLNIELVQLSQGVEPDTWIHETNSMSKVWDSKDRSHYIAAKTSGTLTNLSVAREWQVMYGLGERNAYSILNLNDSYKKKDQLNFMNDPSADLTSTLKGTPDNIERGKRILHAFLVGYRNHPRVIKNMASISMLIETYNETSDVDKVSRIDDLILFFTALSKFTIEQVIEAKAKSEKTALLKKIWKEFFDKLSYTEFRKEQEEMAEKAKQEYEDICKKQRDREEKKQGKWTNSKK